MELESASVDCTNFSMFLGSASINGAYCVYCIFLHAQVEELEKESLPKSASEVVTQVLKQAVENMNSPEVIKALIHRGK